MWAAGCRDHVGTVRWFLVDCEGDAKILENECLVASGSVEEDGCLGISEERDAENGVDAC